MLKLSDFDYELPRELIAQYPLEKRESARLLVLNRRTGAIEHRTFGDITEYFKEGDTLVLNDTKVLASRLQGLRASGGRVEVLLVKRKNNLVFEAMIKPSRVKLQEKISFNNGSLAGIMTARNEMTFNARNIAEVYKHGTMPLPPYIKRIPDDADNIYYQTVYAKNEGAIASPTAGLHFTRELIEETLLCGVNIAYITLHISHATFKPVKAIDIKEHKMEGEYFCINSRTQKLIKQARSSSSRIIAVGTTSCRALETFSRGLKRGHTDLFIYPGYKFKMTDCLITNFHLPRTTLFMLICAFAGERLAKKAYQEAIEKKYRFYSYGDAMLVV